MQIISNASSAAMASIPCTKSLFKPNHSNFVIQSLNKLLKLSADCKNLRMGQTIHGHLMVTNQTSENQVSLINLYAKCGWISAARQLFDRISEKNLVSWSTLMTGYLHCGLPKEVLKLFKNMSLKDDVRPNEYIYTIVFSSCAELHDVVNMGVQCHAHVLKLGLMIHQYVKNALITMYSRRSEVEGALKIFYTVPGYDIYAYNCVLNGLLEEGGHMKEGTEILSRLVRDHVEWDNITYVNAFRFCAGHKNIKLGLLLHNKIIKSSIEWDVFTSSAIIKMYGKCGEIVSARKVFDGLPTRNVVLWTGIMTAYFQNELFEEALSLLSAMQRDNAAPNDYTLSVILNTAAGLSAVRQGEVLHGLAMMSGFGNYVKVENSIITMYAKCGNIEAANRVFSAMMYHDIITWNAMICGYSQHGLGKEALVVFQDMLAAQWKPNYVTFIGVLSACGHLGLVQEGFYYLNQVMKEVGVDAGIEHYTCIVGLLSKAGLLDDAEKLMRSTPVDWDVVAWRTLLSACHVHRNYGVGKRIAEDVLNMDPCDVGTYTLLSNMHAKAKRWDGVVRIRKLMRERNVKKEPGVSWTEIRNVVHIFVSEDVRHPESSQIYRKVNELLSEIKLFGYKPEIAVVLHDVEEELKEACLSYHSEKLAIAYSLMKTPEQAPIRVFKNLRMCEDCHSAVKLFSKVTGRKIIVRDVNRFHSFQNGCCSCADYW